MSYELTWELNLVFDKKTKMYWGFDFSSTRPLISNESKPKVMKYLEEWKAQIKYDYKRDIPIIQEETDNVDKYIKSKKRYYNKLWKQEKGE